jgi:predicted metal-binding membrane protein
VTDAHGGDFSHFLKRDTLVVAAALAVITILAWIYLVVLNGQMQMATVAPVHAAQTSGAKNGMPGMDMAGTKAMSSSAGPQAAITAPAMVSWTPASFLFIFAMWAVMMVGMMTPSVSPMVLVYSRVAKSAAAQGTQFASPAWFACGYLIAWTSFAAAASFAQYVLDRATLLTPMMALQSRPVGGAILVAAGIYQWLPAKSACLANCRAPLAFIQRHGGFQPSGFGSLRLGALHGLYCIGCCWALMLLLFVAGVMNLFWIAALMLVVLAEKILPFAAYLSRGVGAIAIAWGLWLLAS